MNDQPGKRRGRKPKLYPYQGKRLSLAELSRLSGWSINVLEKRIGRGLTAEEAAHNDLYRRNYYQALPVIYKGETRTLEDWASLDWMKRRKITKSKLYARLFQLGWALEEAFGDAPRARPGTKKITIQTPDGPVEKTMSEWADHTGIPLSTISVRRSRGWTDAQALEFEPGPKELRNAEQAERERLADSDEDERDE